MSRTRDPHKAQSSEQAQEAISTEAIEEVEDLKGEEELMRQEMAELTTDMVDETIIKQVDRLQDVKKRLENYEQSEKLFGKKQGFWTTTYTHRKIITALK